MSGGDAQEQDYASPLGATGLHPSICSRGEAEGASLNILHPTCLPTPKSVRTHPPSARIATPRFPDHRAETGSPVSPSAARGRRRAPSRNGSSGGLAFVGASDPPLASRLQAEVVKRIEERESLLVMAGDRCAGAIAGCELCGGVAAVHCAADSAFLCVPCDAKVHGANFLASRHLRRRLVHAAAGEGEDSESESSSSCVSTADSCSAAASAAAGRRRPGCKHRRARAEAVLEGWAKRMGLAPGTARRRAARAAGALRALGRGVPPPASCPRRDGRRALVGGRRIRLRGRHSAPPAGGQLARAGEAGGHGGFVDGAHSGPGSRPRARRGGLGRVLLIHRLRPGPTSLPSTSRARKEGSEPEIEIARRM
ncbi:hypothetical protein ZWY2020_014641 [Hordeum vulgare]|nr:hypothetical protein ZWY2020_014641 [Hordeum vulgare]